MKSILFIFILFFANYTIVNAQKNKSIKTTVVDNYKLPINNAIALVYSNMDSSLVQSHFSDKKGIISFSIPITEEFYCIITKDSFVKKTYTLNKEILHLPDTILLDRLYNTETVLVFGNPITIKEDTIQFNNEMFKKDSIKTLEEVLKKFPGVTIDREGNIEINGQKVSEILLEGKPLPVNDIKAFTQSIQAGLIDKIQFVDKKSDESKISKIDNGQREKVINIKLKSKRKRSYNQDFYLGFGNNNRKEARTNVNYLNNDFYSNASINYNNTGRSTYNTITYFNPNGISKGFNFNNSLRYTGYKKWTIGLYYGLSNQETLFDEQRDRVIFLKDSLNYYKQNLISTNNTKSFSANTYVNFLPDTLGEFKLNLSTTINKGKNNRMENFNTANNSKILTNEGQRANDGNSNRVGFNAGLTGGRRTKNGKSSFYTNTNFAFNNNEDITFQENDIIYYRTTSLGYDSTKQKINNKGKYYSIRTNINFYQTIYKNLKATIGTGINYTNRPTSRQAYYYNYNTQQYETLNTVLTNDLLNRTNVFTQSIGLIYNYKKHTFSSSLNYNQQINKNTDKIKDSSFLQNNKYYTPNLNYSYTDKYLYITANTNISQKNPTSQQLQPIIDNSNPLFIRKGNPDLNNEQTIYFTTTVNKNPTKKGLSYSINATHTIIKNKIANNTYFDNTEGKQVSVPINLPEVYFNNSMFSVNQYFEKTKLNLNAKFNIGFGKDINFLNGEMNKLSNFSIKPSVGVKVNRKKYYIDYAIGYLYQTNKYSLRPTQNIKIGNFTTDASMALLFIKNTEISLDYQQTVNNNKRTIQRINNLNGRVSYTPKWKKPKVTFAISLFDILNQNSNLRQNINDYYEEYVTTNAVRRFVLASVLVKFNKFKAKKGK